MFENYKVFTNQEIKAKCIKADENFSVGEECDAYYSPPFIFLGKSESEFGVINRHGYCIHYYWEDFHEHFEVMTEDFEGIPYIIYEIK